MRMLAAQLLTAFILIQAHVEEAWSGIDQAYTKAEDKQSWGEILNWVFGSRQLGKSYALVVGISQYSGQGFNVLEHTLDDPERVRNFLLDDAGFDHVHVLTDDKVTQDRLRTLVLDDFRNRIGPKDRFILYWSGHGIPVSNFADQQLGYLPLSTSDSTSIASMLAMREVLNWTELIGAMQVLHILDTCFSGLARLPETKSGHRERTVKLLALPARHLLTATTNGGETIAAREWNGSIFTDAFIEGARGEADVSDDGVVDMLELEGFIRKKVDERRLQVNWPSEIKPKSFDLQNNEGEFFFITSKKKREVARAEDNAVAGDDVPDTLEEARNHLLNDSTCDVASDRLFWETIKDKSDPDYFDAYLDRVSSRELCGQFASLAVIELERLLFNTERDAETEEIYEVELGRERVLQIQEMLEELGFDPGASDGVFGARTRAAVIEFQRSIGARVTGRMTVDGEVALAEAVVDFRARHKSMRAVPNDVLSKDLIDGHATSKWLDRNQIEEGIQITNATIGDNCGAEKGNATRSFAERCDGRSRCFYEVEQEIVDSTFVNADECANRILVNWRCGGESEVFEEASPNRATPPGVDVGYRLLISCPPQKVEQLARLRSVQISGRPALSSELNSVRIVRNGKLIETELGMDLMSGDQISTINDTIALISHPEAASVSVKPNSLVRISSPLILGQGSIIADVSDQSDRAFNLKTPYVTASSTRDSVFQVTVEPDQEQVDVLVARGFVVVLPYRSDQDDLLLKAGESFVIKAEDVQRLSAIHAQPRIEAVLESSRGLEDFAYCSEGVASPARNGEIFRKAASGSNEIFVQAGSEDAIVKLKNSLGETQLSFFVKAESEVKIGDIPDGTFYLSWATGRQFSRRCGMFLEKMNASSAENEITMQATNTKYNTLELTLRTAAGGNLKSDVIPLQEFVID